MIAEKDLGIGPYQLQEKKRIHRIEIDDDLQSIKVFYRTEVLAPSGETVMKYDETNYVRQNREAYIDPTNGQEVPALTQYTILKESQVGQMIADMVNTTLQTL